MGHVVVLVKIAVPSMINATLGFVIQELATAYRILLLTMVSPVMTGA
jgi:hypothetical protein